MMCTEEGPLQVRLHALGQNASRQQLGCEQNATLLRSATNKFGFTLLMWTRARLLAPSLQPQASPIRSKPLFRDRFGPSTRGGKGIPFGPELLGVAARYNAA